MPELHVACRSRYALDDPSIARVNPFRSPSRIKLLAITFSACVQTIYSDYRKVDGEMVPFGFVIQGDDGRIVGRVQEVRFKTSIPPSTFRPAQE